MLPLDKTGELVEAAPGFQLVISYNPGYQHALKDLKPSTRQRFVALEFDFPPPEVEAEIVAHEGGVDRSVGGGARYAHQPPPRARRQRARRGSQHAADRRDGAAPRERNPDAVRLPCALFGPLTDDADLLAAMHDLVTATM